MKTFLILFLVLSFNAYTQVPLKQAASSNQESTDDHWEILDEYNYSVKYPPTWQLDQSGLSGTSFFVFSPLESSDDQFKENVNLIIQDLTNMNLDLDKYTDISVNQIKTMFKGSNLLESKKIKNSEGEYQKLIYIGDQGVFHLKFEQYYWVFDDKAYVLTLTTEQSKFLTFKETGEKIMNSFKIK
jgi:hypothetical protein